MVLELVALGDERTELGKDLGGDVDARFITFQKHLPVACRDGDIQSRLEVPEVLVMYTEEGLQLPFGESDLSHRYKRPRYLGARSTRSPWFFRLVCPSR